MNNARNIILVVLLSLIISQEEQPYPPLDLISIPTAGTLPRGFFSMETILMEDGGLLPKVQFGITDRFTFGVSFGVQGFIGTGDIEKNKSAPEVQLKYRIYEETEQMPAVAIGLNTQGKGKFYEGENLQRYEQKAFGVYALMSRNWNLMGNLGFHIGLNKNLFENNDKDEDMNLFFGFDKEINESFSFLLEYNFSRDDDGESDSGDVILRRGKGYLNSGIRWSATDNLMLEINVNDMLKNNKYSDYVYNSNNDVVEFKEFESMNREVKIIYFEEF